MFYTLVLIILFLSPFRGYLLTGFFANSTNGIIRRAGNGWIAIPRQPGNALIEVSADVYGDGKKKSMGAMEFRVKNIPDPIGKVAGKKGGYIDKNLLLAQMVVNADLENFEFDAKFTVTEFVLSAMSEALLRKNYRSL
jgi:hypothetical protein